MPDVIKNWEKKHKDTMFKRVKQKVLKPPPLKERISFTIYRLKVQQGRLEQSASRMQHHYDDLFSKCTKAVIDKESTRAALYANECAELRKMVTTILRSELAIEQVILRLETVEEFGDVVVEMGPVASVINSIRGQLVGVVPEVSYKLGEVGDTLNNLVIEAGGATGIALDLEASGEEAEKILNAANTIAEQKMKERFPTLPAGIPEKEKAPGSTLPTK